ncbi:hypothetical protein LDO51_04055 [Providencia alcalifaciens]|uniref:DUF6630 family protein n=1 Tax=Providencia alcalifaciens TaxID=126385 RepID=UPI001CE176B7|nr:hypothetical protein [Providencia alcalifaciens]UBX50004.1 hypothetical protein LDO51_04055 [Providencia alcalifaciens]
MQSMKPETIALYNELMPAITELATLLNPNSKENTATDIASFEEELKELIDEDEEGFIDSVENEDLGFIIADLVVRSNMGNSFWIDWKDSESAVVFLVEALDIADLDIRLDFGVGDPKNDLRPDQIFVRANQQLQTLGYYLLGLNSGNDAYHEILIPSEIFEPFISIMEQFDVMVDLNDEEVDYSEYE